MNKQELRQLIKERQAFFDPDMKQKADLLIQDRLWTLISGFKSIGIYQSMNDEVDTSRIIKLILASNMTLSSGRCLDLQNMEFAKVSSLDNLKPGVLNILEPTEEMIAIDDIEVLVIPMVAYDQDRNRLGHGKGYYDRYLKNFKGLKIGIAYQYQEVTKIIKEKHDIPMDIIVNENKII